MFFAFFIFLHFMDSFIVNSNFTHPISSTTLGPGPRIWESDLDLSMQPLILIYPTPFRLINYISYLSYPIPSPSYHIPSYHNSKPIYSTPLHPSRGQKPPFPLPSPPHTA